MRLFASTLIIPWLVATVIAAPGEYQAIKSPSGHFVARIGIAGAEASPSVRFRLRLVFETSSGERIGEVWTGYTDSWVVLWSNADVLLAYGKDREREGAPIEAEAYDFRGPRIDSFRPPVQRSLTATERALAVAAFARKYPRTKSRLAPPDSAARAVTPRAAPESR